MTRVALIDDHESVRLGLEAACANAPATDVVFSGSTVTEYLGWRTRSGSSPADVVLLDLTLGDGTTATPLPASASARICGTIGPASVEIV